MKLRNLFIACISTLSVAQAASIAIVNHDFETEVLADTDLNIGAVSGWVASGGGITGSFNPGTAFFTNGNIVDTAGTNGVIGTMDGDSALFIFESTGVTLTNTTTEAVADGTMYTLTVGVGGRDAGLSVFGGYLIELLDGDSVLASATSSTIPAAGTFADVTVNYTGQASDAGNLAIRLSSLDTTTVNRYVDFDNVRLEATVVPEPSSIALLGLGGLALILRRKK